MTWQAPPCKQSTVELAHLAHSFANSFANHRTCSWSRPNILNRHSDSGDTAIGWDVAIWECCKDQQKLCGVQFQIVQRDVQHILQREDRNRAAILQQLPLCQILLLRHWRSNIDSTDNIEAVTKYQHNLKKTWKTPLNKLHFLYSLFLKRWTGCPSMFQHVPTFDGLLRDQQIVHRLQNLGGVQDVQRPPAHLPSLEKHWRKWEIVCNKNIKYVWYRFISCTFMYLYSNYEYRGI